MINIVKNAKVKTAVNRQNETRKETALTKVEKSLVKNKKKPFDLGLIITIFILLSLGLIIVLSSSAPSALSSYGDSYYFFKRQLVSAMIGIFCMFVASFFDYRLLKGKIANFGIIASIVLLILVLVPRSRYYNQRCYKMD